MNGSVDLVAASGPILLPGSVRTMADMLLVSAQPLLQPLLLIWGLPRRVLYNEPMVQLLRLSSRVTPLQEMWGKAWPLVADAVARAEAGERQAEIRVIFEDRAVLGCGGPVGPAGISLSLTPVFNSEGAVDGVWGFCHDLTAQLETERALDIQSARLERSEGWLSSISHILPGYIWMANRTGQLTFTTQAWLEYAGITQANTLSNRWNQFVHQDDSPRVSVAWTRSATEGVPYEAEFRCRRRDGSYRWFLVRADAERDADGTVLRWVGMNVDIEHQKDAEAAFLALNTTLEQRVAEGTQARDQIEGSLRQAQKMEAIGQLTGGIAHDFNNMLQSVLGSLDLIGRRLDQGRHAEVPHLVEMAMQGATRAAALTARLLSFARRQALAPQPLDANALVTGMEELVRNTVGTDVQVELALAPDLPAVLCDANQMERAILNLAINARDAMRDGGTLRLSTAEVTITEAHIVGHPGVTPGQFVELSVTDTGVGMADQVASSAFEPFSTTKPIGQGTGLGLSQLYGFVRQSGGLVQLESAPGLGTTIRLQLPCSTGLVSDEAEPLQPVRKSAAARGKVLLVEDDEVIRSLAREALTEQGWIVLEAECAAKALAILDAVGSVHVLVTDVGLPGGMNGRQLAEVARQAQAGLAVLFVTGHAETALADGAMEPRTAMISKPFRLSALTEQVAALVVAG